MLSRTADHLFWMARYMERAENTARLLEVTWQTSLLPQSPDRAEQGWLGVLGICELARAFGRRNEPADAASVMRFMVREPANSASIVACLAAARENARAVRGTLTTELWETTNQSWLEFNRMLADGEFERDPDAVFEWVKFRSHLSRGVTLGTMLHDEALHFMRLGTFVERADNSARLLDVRFHALAGEADGAHEAHTAPESDLQHWAAILRSVSAFEIYRRVYRDVIRPDRVAELLILRPDMPRSLAASVNALVPNLEAVANDQSGHTLQRARTLRAELQDGRIAAILDSGLHEFLTEFLERVNDIGAGISRDFLVAG